MKLSLVRSTREVKSAAYVRVSSKSQDGAMQRDAIERASTQRCDHIAPELWFEEKRTGKKLTRPVLDQVRQLVREGRIERLYVWKLDRLTRSGIVDTLQLVKELREHGCELICLAGLLTFPAGPAGDMILSIYAAVAELELAGIEERRTAARERILAAGGTWGRPKRTTEAIELRMFELAAKGRSHRAIAMALKVPRATVGRVLRRLKSTVPNGSPRSAKKERSRKTVPPPAH
jgi:DNA invertase Pin-like site-specific DNA recombinase